MFRRAILSACLLLPVVSGCGGGSDSGSEATESEDPMVTRSLARDPGPATEYAVVRTNHGDIKLRFFPNQAPLAVSNFKGLAVKGYYNGLTFHRVMPGFMIQGGDPNGDGTGGESLWGSDFRDEYHPALTFGRPGLLAMANVVDKIVHNFRHFTCAISAIFEVVPVPPHSSNPLASRKTCVRVEDRNRAKAWISSAQSISRLIPGTRTTDGSMPCCRATRR